MDVWHLWWIIPVAFIVGLVLGYFFGIYDLTMYLRSYTGNICNLL